MPFPYYDNLSTAKKSIYRKSDAIESIPVKDPGGIQPAVLKLKKSLEDNKRRDVAKHASELCRQICEDLDTEALIVKIRSQRPSSAYFRTAWTLRVGRGRDVCSHCLDEDRRKGTGGRVQILHKDGAS